MPDQERVLSVRLPADLYEELRRFAFDRRIAQADVIREGIRSILTQAKQGAQTGTNDT